MKKFLFKIYVYRFFDDLILIYPLYVVMFTDSGMMPGQVAILLTIWSATAFLLEIPSGVWADKYSRKNILFISQCVRACGYICWILFPNFWGFAVGFVFWGIKSALSSGTFQALLYDELKYFAKENEYTKILGKSKTLSFTAMLIASVLASPGILLGYPFVLVLSSVATMISGICILTIPKARPVESTHEKEYFSLLKEGLSETIKNPKILPIMIFLSLAFALGWALDEYWTIFAKESWLPHYGIGLFMAIWSGSQAIANAYAYYFEKRTDSFFYFLFFLSGILLAWAGYLFSVPALLLLILFSFLFAIIQVIFEWKLQHSINSSTRATITSVSWFFIEIIALVIYLSFGFLAQITSYQTGFFIFGIIIAMIGLIYILSKYKLHKNKEVL